MSEIYTNSQEQSFEVQMWEDIKKDFGYKDNNKGFIFGCHPIDEDGQIIDCNWFKSEEKRSNFMEENSKMVKEKRGKNNE